MSSTSDKYREAIAAAALPDAKKLALRALRRGIRYRWFDYCQEHRIVDANDTVMCGNRHRDFRSNLISTAQGRVPLIQAASSTQELLNVFDTYADYI